MKNIRRKMAGVILGVGLIMGVGVVSVSAAWEKENGICYNDQGEVIQGAVAKGIDVSSWQEEVDWDAVKGDGIEFAFIRVRHGDEPLDVQFHRNMSEANRVGIPVGVYYYSMALTPERAAMDAQYTIRQMEGYEVGYPVVVDMESSVQLGLSTKERTDIALAFCREIEKAGYYPMVYCNEYWHKTYLDMERMAEYDKWIARYASTYDASIGRDIWQCTSSGSVAGIEGNADIDFAFTDYTKIITPRTKADPSYVPVQYGWIEDNTGWWYRRLDGSYPKDGWVLLNGAWYYMNAAGYMETGWILDGDTWYYLSESGAMETGWQKLNGVWYYLSESGAMETGWVYTGGRWYYLYADGSMAVGWILDGDTWYYLSKSGAMETGWQAINGIWYYLDASGAMWANTWTPDGYWVDENGAWLP